MKIKMLRTTKGSDRDANGLAKPVTVYEEGKIYEIGDSLSDSFIKNKDAEIAKDDGEDIEEKKPGEALGSETNAPAKKKLQTKPKKLPAYENKKGKKKR